jgi:hypothetical protein
LIGCVVVLLGAAPAIARDRGPGWSPALVVGLAVLIRLMFVADPPGLSDDIHRYLWDGGAVLCGRNPYSLPPAAIVPRDLAEAALQARVNHPELVTIYPPAAQLLFAAGAALHSGVVGMKALFCALDILACILIIRILRILDLPIWRAALYAWHPLPVLEIAGSGHVDGAAVLWLLVALWLVLPAAKRSNHGGKDPLAGAAAAFAVLTKLLPVLMLPAILVVIGRRRSIAFIVGGTIAAVALIIPFRTDTAHAIGTLATYGRNWEFASFTFRSLRRILGSGDVARITLAGAFVLCSGWAILAPLIRPRTQAAGPLDGLRVAYAIVIAFLLLSPTLHPWYALYLAALLPFVAGPAGFALSGSVFLGYRVLPLYARTGQWIESDLIAFAIFAIPVVAFVIGKSAARALDRARADARVPPPSR